MKGDVDDTVAMLRVAHKVQNFGGKLFHLILLCVKNDERGYHEGRVSRWARQTASEIETTNRSCFPSIPHINPCGLIKTVIGGALGYMESNDD